MTAKIPKRQFVRNPVVLGELKRNFTPGRIFTTQEVVELFPKDQQTDFASFKRIQSRLISMTSPSEDSYVDPPIFERIDGIGSNKWKMTVAKKTRIEVISEIIGLLQELK